MILQDVSCSLVLEVKLSKPTLLSLLSPIIPCIIPHIILSIILSIISIKIYFYQKYITFLPTMSYWLLGLLFLIYINMVILLAQISCFDIL